MEQVQSGSTATVGGTLSLVLSLVAVVLVGVAQPAAAAPAVPCAPGVRVCIELSDARAWLLDVGGRVLRGPVAITSGAAGMETPTGRFSVQWKNAHHVSSFGGVPMPWSVFFDRQGRALHGGSLQRQSRGCVHLADADARAFFDALAPGAGIEILP